MRCKICGAKLKKEGDICRNCYHEYKEKEKLETIQEEELLRVNRRYSPKFNLLKNGEIILLLIIVALAGLSAYTTFIGILITVLCVIIFGLWMFFNKKRAMGTKTIFYETKFKYIAKYPLVNREEMVLYNDIKDMAYFQTRSQKMCKIGDIRFYTKGFLAGVTINDIPDIEETFNKIRDIINSTRD